MISISFSLQNPFSRGESARAIDWFFMDKKLARHKCMEIQLARWSSILRLCELELDTMLTGRDHAGPRLYASLLGLFICVQIYDTRHWDYDNHRWEDA